MPLALSSMIESMDLVWQTSSSTHAINGNESHPQARLKTPTPSVGGADWNPVLPYIRQFAVPAVLVKYD